jgi:HSP20 family protein
MQLVKWNHWQDVNNLQRHLSAVWDKGFDHGLIKSVAKEDWTWSPTVDVFQNETQITIKAELPGVDKDKIAVSVQDGVLRLSGERSEEASQETGGACRRERVFGRFTRSFSLPAEVDAEKISADYRDGVLTIEVPKPEKQRPRRITIH